MPGRHQSCCFLKINFRAQNNAIRDCKHYATFIAHWLSALVVICRGLPHTVPMCARLPRDLTRVSLIAGQLQKRISNYPALPYYMLFVSIEQRFNLDIYITQTEAQLAFTRTHSAWWLVSYKMAFMSDKNTTPLLLVQAEVRSFGKDTLEVVAIGWLGWLIVHHTRNYMQINREKLFATAACYVSATLSMQLKCKTPAQGQGAPAKSPTEAMPRHHAVQLPCMPF